MRARFVIPAVLSSFLLAGTASAFQCPTDFAAAEEAIEAATQAAKGMPDGDQKKLVHALIDDAKMYLASGRHNHEKPQGKYDHARAIAKAKTAKGHAEAAAILARN